MTAKRYSFDGELMTVAEIMARYPAYGETRIRNSLTKMHPPAIDRAGLDRWDVEAKRRVKQGARIGAALGHVQMVRNSNGGETIGDPTIAARKVAWARSIEREVKGRQRK